MPRDAISMRIQHEGLEWLVTAIRAEEDGKQLRRELAKELRDTLKPAAAQAKSGIMAMSSAGPGTSPALRPSIAKRIRPEVKLGGRWTGARIKARKTPNIRGFANAPKRTQSRKGWRTDTFGRDNWRVQFGRVEWFDRAVAADADSYRRACQQALDDMAARIAARARG
ncbi:hypothetical protein ACGFNU_24395 [Spirillospora sp. NPDC048911]|uniref:hypothetical protein n=1 Tax=Spirillospora sp. NPDC048911 TaxID=3364527 RepID=UPI003714D1A2